MAADRTPFERDYSPSTCLDEAVTVEQLLAAYRAESEHARAVVPPRTFAYGSLPSERLDVFAAEPAAEPAAASSAASSAEPSVRTAARTGTPAHLFVHGGYWQELSKDDSSFPAPAFLARGITYITVDYGLAPAFTLDRIVAQVRRAIGWVHAHANELGIDPGQLVVSGSSAGAHLAAMAAVAAPEPAAGRSADGVPAGAIGGLVLLSGIYDLEPLVDTYINDAVGMDHHIAQRNSPLRYVAEPDVSRNRPAVPPLPTLLAWGEHETRAFKQQSNRFADALDAFWHEAGHPVTRLEAAGRNHFDIVHDLANPETPLGAEVARLHETVRSSR